MAWPAALIFLLGVLLTASACASGGVSAPGSAAVGTSPPLDIEPAHPLTWKKHTVPTASGFTNIPGWGTGTTIAPGDGNTAYSCAYAGLWQIWATHDQAEHWTQAATIAADSARDQDCLLVVDANQSTHVIAALLPRDAYGADTPRSDVQSYVSTDGGTTWTKLAAPANDTPLYTALATHGNTTYALARGTCLFCKQMLYRSTDGTKTWARADTGVFEEKNGRATRSMFGFWTATNGDLLATIESGLNGELWRSTDGGDHWSTFAQTEKSVMGSGPISNNGIVAAGGQAAFWRACVSNIAFASNPHDHTMEITCTLDGGKTWLATGSRETNVNKRILAQAPDGEVLATTFEGYHSALVRIAPGRQTWESLGTAPGPFSFTYARGADGKRGVLWSNMTTETDQQGQDRTIIYTATYP